MTIRKLHPESDNEPVVFGDIDKDPLFRDLDITYCDVCQVNTSNQVIITALTSNRLAFFLSKFANVSLQEINTVILLPPHNDSHIRLCVAILKSCGIEPSSITFVSGGSSVIETINDKKIVCFICGNEWELMKLKKMDVCPVSYGNILDKSMFTKFFSFLRYQSVFSRDWFSKCTRRSIELVVAVDTVLLSSSNALISRSVITKLLTRYRSVFDITTYLSQYLPVHGATIAVIKKLGKKQILDHKFSTKQVSEQNLTIPVDSDLFSILFLSTRDGSGTVTTVSRNQYDIDLHIGLRIGDALRIVPRLASEATVRTHSLHAKIADITYDNSLKLSIPPQQAVLHEISNQNKYKCVSADDSINKTAIGRFSRAQCEQDGEPYVWDRPCTSDNDCPMKQTSCTSGGYCMFPPGVKRIGFRKFLLNNNSYPVCNQTICDPLLITANLSKYIDCCVQHIQSVKK